MDAAPRTIGTLTSLRWVAATLVLLHHGLAPIYRQHPDSALLATLDQGRTGVTFFFVLSGFVLTWVYQRTFMHLEVRAMFTFWIARVARIWPLHAVTFVASIAVMFLAGEAVGGAPRLITSGVLNLFLVQGIAQGGTRAVSFNGVSWTLGCELVFYAVLPVVLFAALRLHRGPATRLLWWSVGAWLAVGYVAMGALSEPSTANMMNVSPFFRASDFVVGVALALCYAERGSRGAGGRGWWTLLELGVIAVAGASLWLGGNVVAYAFTQTVWATPSAALLVWVFAHERGLVSRLLQTRTLLYLGELSFGIYMWHQLVLRTQWALWDGHDLRALLVAVPASLLLAATTYHLVEVPQRRAIRRRGARWLDARLAQPPVVADADGDEAALVVELERPAA
jgi:peptidoglycan/LPS O-acetylase OafA/YrhL